MTFSAENKFVRGSAVLAEGLDFPRPELVSVSPENPLLRCLAPVEEWADYWPLLTGWMESYPDPHERLNSLQAGYYQMFLRPGTGISVYLRDWYPNQSPAEFLSGLQTFLDGLDLAQSSHWHNGSDHLAIVFELLAHLGSTGSPGVNTMVQQYLRPWFPVFVTRMKEQAMNDFYRVLSHIAAEVNHAMESIA